MATVAKLFATVVLIILAANFGLYGMARTCPRDRDCEVNIDVTSLAVRYRVARPAAKVLSSSPVVNVLQVHVIFPYIRK
jgi:hypothetical protein